MKDAKSVDVKLTKEEAPKIKLFPLISAISGISANGRASVSVLEPSLSR